MTTPTRGTGVSLMGAGYRRHTAPPLRALSIEEVVAVTLEGVRQELVRLVEAGDLALVHWSWMVELADGEVLEGASAEVLRLTDDGWWVFVIDNSDGADMIRLGYPTPALSAISRNWSASVSTVSWALSPDGFPVSHTSAPPIVSS